MKKNKSTKVGIIVAVLLLAVGFASVTTTLWINGTAVIKPDKADFEKNVIFTQATLTNAAGETVENGATIETDKRHITFTTGAMSTIGDNYTLTYTVSNNSQYNARITGFKCEQVEGEGESETTSATFDEHISVTSAGLVAKDTANSVEGTLIAKDGSKADNTVRVEMVKSYVGNDTNTTDNVKNIKIRCTIDATAEEASN